MEGVRVKSSLRGKGIGRMLFDKAIEIARENECELVQLTSDKVRTDAAEFYKSLGFAESHIGFKMNLM